MATFPAPTNQPSPLSPLVPLNSPMVGFASPFEHADGQNRDIILESIRAWASANLLTWSAGWQTFFTGWIANVDAYLSANAITGFSWRTTATPITGSGTTVVTIDPGTAILRLGDLVVDQTSNSNYGIITTLVDLTHAVVTYLGYLHGIAGPTVVPADTAIAGFINTPGTLTKTALDATYLAPVAYVPPPTGIHATDTANILAAVNKLSTGPNTGGTVVLRAGVYEATLPAVGNILYQGQGRLATEITNSVGIMVNCNGLFLLGLSFEKLTLSSHAGHIFELGNGINGIANGRFTDVAFTTYTDAASVFHGTGNSSLQSYNFSSCYGTRNQTATVPAFDLKSAAGGYNCNIFSEFTTYSNYCNTTPYWRIEATNGSYSSDNIWSNIIGERDCGGLIHLYSASNTTLVNIADYDAAPNNYTDHLVNIQTSTTAGMLSRNINASNIGTRQGTMAAGKNHFNCATVSGPMFLDRIGDPNGTQKVSYVVGQSIRDASGTTGSYEYVTVSASVNADLSGTMVGNGPSLTITLPDASLLPYVGRKFTIKNVNSTAMIVNATGGRLIDGATTVTLTQWQSITVITEGSTWYRV